jgi:Xaa-Pro aminopeptidase
MRPLPRRSRPSSTPGRHAIEERDLSHRPVGGSPNTLRSGLPVANPKPAQRGLRLSPTAPHTRSARSGESVTNYLAWGTTFSPSLTQAIPISALSDPIGYLEVEGRRYILSRGGDEKRVRALQEQMSDSDDSFELVLLAELGWTDLQEARVPFHAAMAELVLRACRHLHVTDVRVPDEFSSTAAEHLRRNGVAVETDPEEFLRRRRVKTALQLEGVRRAQHAAERSLDHLRMRLREGTGNTVNDLRQEMVEVYAQNGSEPHYDFLVIAVGAHSADGMDPGDGADTIREGVPILIDCSPRDYRTGMWGDICRTYSVGGEIPELVEWNAVACEALEAAKATVGPGVPADVPYYAALDVLEAAGHSTLRTMAAGKPMGATMFNHAVGHGIGFELHDWPHISEWGASEALLVGDVLALEPGVYKPGFGGCRVEDLVIVTEDGYELITDYDYATTP